MCFNAKASRCGLAVTCLAVCSRIVHPVCQAPEAAFDGFTATQNFYQFYDMLAPDYLTALYVADIFCYPACSQLGPYTMFNDQYSSLGVFRSVANSAYHSMQWTLRKRCSRGYQFDLNYTNSSPSPAVFGKYTGVLTRPGVMQFGLHYEY